MSTAELKSANDAGHIGALKQKGQHSAATNTDSRAGEIITGFSVRCWRMLWVLEMRENYKHLAENSKPY